MAKQRNRVTLDAKKVVFNDNSDSGDFEINSSENELISLSDENELLNKKKSNKKSYINDIISEDSEEGEIVEEEEEEEGDYDDDDNNNNENLKEGGNNKNKESEFTKITWGKEKRNYYQERDEDSEFESDNEDEEDKLARLKEAIYLNEKEKENLKEADFDLRNIYLNQPIENIEDDEEFIQKKGANNKKQLLDKHQDAIHKLIGGITDDLNKKKQNMELELNEEEKKEAEELIMSEQEEYKILLKDLSTNIEKVTKEINENIQLFQIKNIDEQKINPSDINKNTLLYLKKKNETLLTYIIYITYYIFLKVMNSYNYNHPVLEKLIYMNTLLAKANELDPKIKFKINQLNNAQVYTGEKENEQAKEEEEEEEEIKKKKTQRNNEEEAEEEEEDSTDFEEHTDICDDEEEKEGNYKKEKQDEDEGQDPSLIDKENKNAKYRVKKNLITEYTDSHIRAKEKEEKQKNKEKMKNEKDIYIKELKSMISNKPEKIEDNYLKKMENKFSAFDKQLSKKEMKKILNKSKRNQLNNVGLTTNDLLKFVEIPEMNRQEKITNFEEKKIFRNSINKLTQIKKNELSEKFDNDDYVTYKKIDKEKLNRTNTKYGQLAEAAKETEQKKKRVAVDLKIDSIEDEDIKHMLKFKKQRKEMKQKRNEEKNKEIRKKLVMEENQEVENRRKPDIGIIKNKGLIKKKKSKVSSSRVRHRQKFAKKMKAYSGQHAKLREHDENYSGEQRGINPNIKKSMDIK